MDPLSWCSKSRMTAWWKYCWPKVNSSAAARRRHPFSGAPIRCAQGLSFASLGFCFRRSSRFGPDAAAISSSSTSSSFPFSWEMSMARKSRQSPSSAGATSSSSAGAFSTSPTTSSGLSASPAPASAFISSSSSLATSSDAFFGFSASASPAPSLRFSARDATSRERWVPFWRNTSLVFLAPREN